MHGIKKSPRTSTVCGGMAGAAWLGRPDLNRRLAESKSAALPLGYTPIQNYKIKAQIEAQQSGFDLERKKESA